MSFRRRLVELRLYCFSKRTASATTKDPTAVQQESFTRSAVPATMLYVPRSTHVPPFVC